MAVSVGGILQLAGIGYQLFPRRCNESQCLTRYEILLRQAEVKGKIMDKIHPVVLVFISGIFGALLTYFFKTVFQTKSIIQIIHNSIGESMKKEFKTHILIHHKDDPDELVDDKIEAYSREVDYKIEQLEKQIKSVLSQGTVSKEMLHGIDITIVGIMGDLKTLKEKIKNGSG